MEMPDSAAVPTPVKPTLVLDDKALVLAGTDSLHVASRRGSFDLRATDIHRLHERLAPHLRGAYTEDELLRAVSPPQVRAVRDYLANLRRVGALQAEPRTVDPEEGLPLERLGSEQRRGRFRIRSRVIDISLDGLWGREAARLCFVTPARAATWLSTLVDRPARRLGFQTCVVVRRERSSSERWSRWAAYARWLLHSGAVQFEEAPRCQLYQLDAASGSLERLVVVDPGMDTSRVQSLPEQLGLIRSGDVDQVPLVVATAGHPWFAPPSITRFGMTWEGVRDDLLRHFIVATWLESRPARRRLSFFRGPLGASPGAYAPVRVARSEIADLVVASSRPALEARLLARAAAREAESWPHDEWQPLDLLAEPAASLEMACLQGILGLRGGSPAARWTRVGEVYLLRWGERRAGSLLRRQAVHELLLEIAYRRFYDPSLDASPVRDPRPFADVATLRSILRDALARHPASAIEMVTRRVRGWGISAWAGALARPATLTAR